MRKLFCLFLLSFLPLAAQPQSEREAIATELNDFHQAAAAADGERYFGHFAPQGVFLGTDLTERWDLAAFKAYAMPYFEKGKGWTYTPQSRNIDLAPDGQTAWFDEVLRSKNYGSTRGSGVLIKKGDRWLLTQYHLTVPIPNDLLPQVVKLIEAR